MGVLASLSIRFLSGINLGVLVGQSRISDGVSQPNLTRQPSDGLLKEPLPTGYATAVKRLAANLVS